MIVGRESACHCGGIHEVPRGWDYDRDGPLTCPEDDE